MSKWHPGYAYSQICKPIRLGIRFRGGDGSWGRDDMSDGRRTLAANLFVGGCWVAWDGLSNYRPRARYESGLSADLDNQLKIEQIRRLQVRQR